MAGGRQPAPASQAGNGERRLPPSLGGRILSCETNRQDDRDSGFWLVYLAVVFPMAVPEYLMSALTDVGAPAAIVAVAGGCVRVAREALLHKAASTALDNGDESQRREAGLKIVEALTRREPWWRGLLPGRRSDDDQ